MKKKERKKRKVGGSNATCELLLDALSNFSTVVFMIIYPPYRYTFMRESPLGL